MFSNQLWMDRPSVAVLYLHNVACALLAYLKGACSTELEQEASYNFSPRGQEYTTTWFQVFFFASEIWYYVENEVQGNCYVSHRNLHVRVRIILRNAYF